MKNNIRILVTLLAVLFVTIVSNKITAQDYKADLEQSIAIYSSDAYFVEMEYLFFPSYTSPQSMEREMIWVKKYNDLFHTKQFGLETIYDDQYVVLIDDESKLLAIDVKSEPKVGEKMDKDEKEALENALQGLSDALGLEEEDAPEKPKFTTEYLGVRNGLKSYAFVYDSGPYSKLVISIDDESKLLNKTVVYYSMPMEIAEGQFSKTRVEINYLKQEVNPSFDADDFSLSNYVDIYANGQVELKGKCANYQVINHLADPEQEN